MKLTRLKIENFLSVQDATLYLKDKGLVSIEGENLDATGSTSNGSGKSSVINAIIWCLYGSYGKDEAADDVVNSKAGKNCMVQLQVEDLTPYRECVYRITRYRKHSKGKNGITVEQMFIPMMQGEACFGWQDITKAGASNVQQQINEIMGADETVFRAACFCQQENPLDIPAMSDKELKALLERVLPFEELEGAYEKASKEVSLCKARVRHIQNNIDLKEKVISLTQEELNEAEKNFRNYLKQCTDKDAEIDKLVKGKKQAIITAQTIIKNNSSVAKEVDDLKNEIDTITNTDTGMIRYKMGELEKKIQKREKALETVEVCLSCGQKVPDAQEQMFKLQDEVSELDDQRNTLAIQLHDAKKNKQRKDNLMFKLSEKNEAMSDYWEAERAVAQLQREIKLLQGQRLNPAVNPHEGTVKRLNRILEAERDDLNTGKAELANEQATLELYEAAQHTLSPKGVRYHMLEKVAPKLTADTNKYLQLLTDGAITAIWSTVSRMSSGEYKEKFSIEAHMESRTKFGLLSGGEKRKVRLACFFALQDLIASRATKNIELWVGDEIDVALDEAGMERLMVLLEEKGKTKSTILVISHNELREWVPSSAVVTRKDGVSSVTGFLNG